MGFNIWNLFGLFSRDDLSDFGDECVEKHESNRRSELRELNKVIPRKNKKLTGLRRFAIVMRRELAAKEFHIRNLNARLEDMAEEKRLLQQELDRANEALRWFLEGNDERLNEYPDHVSAACSRAFQLAPTVVIGLNP